MDLDNIHALYRYALAVAAGSDDWRERELGPIHLLKYLYLADLAWVSAGNEGSWSGVPWKFHHFGPWSAEAWREIEPAVHSVGARVKRIPSTKFEDDTTRYELSDRGLERELGRVIPFPVRRAIRASVQRFGKDTSALLHHVYTTAPMVSAAPGELLDISLHPRWQPSRPGDSAPSPPQRSTKQRRKRREAIGSFREAFTARLRARRDTEAGDRGPAPRYDEVFEAGAAWIDGLAGEAVPVGDLGGEFDDAVWKSPTRKLTDVP